MNNQFDKTTPNLSDLFKHLWAPIAAFLGAVTLVVEFIQLWKGDQATVTWVAAGLGLAGLLIALIWVGFSKMDAKTLLALPERYRTRQPRYPKYYKVARLGLVLILLGTIGAGYFLSRRIVELENKVVVLIADFDGPDPNNYRVTEQLVVELNASLQDYDDVIIQPLNRTITEQEGSQTARQLGERYHADLVLWGWYGLTGSDVLLTLHVENLVTSACLPVEPSEICQTRAALFEIESFTLQQWVGGQMAALVHFVSGIIHYEAGDYEEAIRRFTSALAGGEWVEDIIGQDVLFFYRGTAQAFLSQYEQAIADFDRAIQLDPQDAKAYSNRGAAYADLGQYEQAIADFDQAIQINPQYAEVYTNRGAAYAGLGQYEQAITDYDRAIQLDPQYAEAYYNRGVAYADLSRYEQAIADYDRAIQINPQDAEAYYNRGVAHYKLGQYEEAIADYDRAIQINPQLAEAYSNRGAAYADLGQHEQAIADYDRAIQLDPQLAEAYYNRGLAYANLGQYEQAIADYDRAIQINPQYVEVYSNRGLAYANLGQYEQAIADYERAIQINPQLAEAYNNRGAVYANLGQHEQAIADYDQAIQINPQLAEAYYNRGVAYADLGQHEQAIADFRKVLEISQDPALIQMAEEALRNMGVEP